MHCSTYIATSLDGYIADSSGGISWLTEIPNPSGDDFGFQKFLSRIDALVMGRRTFETVCSFLTWPYNIPVYVASSTLSSTDERLLGRASVINGNPKDICVQLSNEGHHRLYIDGANTIQRFLGADLIDEMIITMIPTCLGEGIPLFARGASKKSFEIYQSDILSIGAIQTRYRRKK